MPPPANASRAPAWKPIMLVVLTVAIVVVAAVALAGGGSSRRPQRTASAGKAAAQASVGSTSAVASTTTMPPTTTVPATTVPATTSTTISALQASLPPANNGSLPQTTAEPSSNTAAFRSEVALLWAAIRSGQPSVGMPAFFPESAYLQVKALGNDAADWTDRLAGHFDLDVEAAHQLLGAGAAAATLVGVLVPSGQAAWIPPGYCYNRIGYWHVPGSRLVYDENGQERSIGIASLISWRGYWYVVHLGAVSRPSDQGVVDNPAIGTGTFGPAGGC